jgi:Zn-dependent protease
MTALQQWFSGIDLSRIIEWLMFGAAAILAISVHESAHGLAALWRGDDTAKRMGRITLNPLRHLDPVGFAMMIFAHFGWARPVPVNPWRMTKIKSRKAGMAITAAAGPISNVLLALIFSFLTALFCIFYYRDAAAKLAAGTLTTQQTPLFYLYEFFYVCMVLNAGLAVFNLIPISPLDGSKILAIFLPDRAHDWLMRYERYGFIILAIVLFTGILNGPLSFLREGLINGLLDVTSPLAEWIAGA